MGTLQKICEIDFKESKEEKIKAFAEKLVLSGIGQTAEEQTAEEQTAAERTAAERTAAERTAAERTAAEQTAAERNNILKKMNLQNLSAIMADKFDGTKRK